MDIFSECWVIYPKSHRTCQFTENFIKRELVGKGLYFAGWFTPKALDLILFQVNEKHLETSP